MDEPRRVTTCVGIDVSKDRLDVHLRPSGEAFAVARDGKGLENLVERLAALDVSLIVLEATGGFETTVAAALAGAGLPLAVVNPRQIRDFARALGRLAKTDAIDAAVIASFAEKIRPEAERATAAANIVSAFKNIWANSWGPRLEYILVQCAALVARHARIKVCSAFPACFVDERISRPARTSLQRSRRALLLADANTPRYDSRLRNEAISPIQNKIGASCSPIHSSDPILCQNSSTIDIHDVMNTGKVLIVNLSKGNLGTEPAHLLGALLITACVAGGRGAAAHARSMSAATSRCMSTNSRTSRLIASHRSSRKRASGDSPWSRRTSTIAQLPDGLQHAVFGNAGTIVAFRVGAHRRQALAAELGMSNPRRSRRPTIFTPGSKLMRDGTPLEPRLIETLRSPVPRARA